ncbi:MAG: hypothetical protein Q8903_15155 [Bacteroidota bacterium]|nr:hypothetical protein [Bacteroidota bacterium]
MKKLKYFWIGSLSFFFTAINSPFSHSSNESGIAYRLGEFTGSFLLTYACIWLMFKVDEMFNKA